MEKSIFFIGISLPHLLENDIHGIKDEFRQKYGVKGGFRSKAHITLQMPFNLATSMEIDLLHDLKKLLIKQKPFELKLNDFGKFETRVIFINVVENEQLNLLQKSIERFMKRFQIFNSTHKNNGFNPHITIAFRDLKKPIFYQIWDEVQKRPFKENFIANSVSVFKHNGESWDIFEEIKLDQP